MDSTAFLGDMGSATGNRYDGGTLQSGQYNPAKAMARLNSRGAGFDALFKRREDVGDHRLETHQDRMVKELTAVGAEQKDDGVSVQDVNRARFERQTRDIKAGRLIPVLGGGWQGPAADQHARGTAIGMIRRTQSMPESPTSPVRPRPDGFRRKDAIDEEDLSKDQLAAGAHGKSLLRSVGGRKKVAADRFAEMSAPWMAGLDKMERELHGAQRAHGGDHFSDSSSAGSQSPAARTFGRVQSAPSPKLSTHAKDASGRNDADGTFKRAESAPRSGYVQEPLNDDFARTASNATASTYASSDPQDFEVVPEAQLQQMAFTRALSAPDGANRPMTPMSPSGSETRKGRAHGKSPRAKNKNKIQTRNPQQTVEEAAEELYGQGLTAEWVEGKPMPKLVAELFAERLNWDDVFATAFPSNGPKNGIWTPEIVRQDFMNFLQRRDAMVVNYMTEMQAKSASHIVRFFTTNDGMRLLRKNGGCVSDVVEGVHASNDNPRLPQHVHAMLQESAEACRTVYMKDRVTFLEHMMYPDSSLDEKYDNFTPSAAEFCVFRQLDGKFGRNMMYNSTKYQHYAGWLMVHRRDNMNKSQYKVQLVSAFSANLVQTKVMSAIPYLIRPQKNFSTMLIYYSIYDKYEKCFDSMRAHLSSSMKALKNIVSTIGGGKHFR